MQIKEWLKNCPVVKCEGIVRRYFIQGMCGSPKSIVPDHNSVECIDGAVVIASAGDLEVSY